jgi:hypothetical protein
VKKILTGALLAALPLTLIAAAPAAHAARSADLTNVEIGLIGYNAYGADTASNRNQEFVEIRATGANVDLNGLLIQDAWARGNNRQIGCNTARLGPNALPVAAGGTGSTLPAGKTLRVHMGAGVPAIDRLGVYHTYRNMPVRCGHNGHIFNNGPSANRWAPWDTAWITLGGVSKSKPYNYSFGYTTG